MNSVDYYATTVLIFTQKKIITKHTK